MNKNNASTNTGSVSFCIHPMSLYLALLFLIFFWNMNPCLPQKGKPLQWADMAKF